MSADPPRGEPRVHAALTESVLDPAAAQDFVADPTAGGVGLFLGVVRNHHAGEAVDHLHYEAWQDEALPRLHAVVDEVVAEFGGVRAAWVEHRLGDLAIGEAAVVAAASAPHRAEAMDAARALIDRTKERVPIWKRETLADGTTRWPGTDC